MGVERGRIDGGPKGDVEGWRAAVAVLSDGVDGLADLSGDAAGELVREAARMVREAATSPHLDASLLQLCEELLAAHYRTAEAGHCQRRRDELRGVVATVVEAALVEPDVDLVLEAAVSALREGLQCQGVSIRAFDAPESASMRRFSASYPAGAEDLVTDELLDISGRAARVCWDRQTASLMHVDHPDVTPLTTSDERDFMFGFMRFIGAREMLMAPLGAGRQCQGWIGLTRTEAHPAFDEDDVDAVLAVGREIGNVVAHARSFVRQQELIGRLRDLNDLNVHKSRFTATLAHQLRNPLMSIQLHLEELSEEGLLAGERSATPQSLAAMERAARRIHGITDSVLALAQLQESARPPTGLPVDLRRLVMDCVSDNEEIAQAGGVALDTSAITGAPRTPGHRDELEMIIDNLVGNAIKYSTPGCTVRLGLEHRGGWVRFTCQDDGIGMGDDDQALLFSPFHRGADAVRRQIPGSGLGMAIVHAAVERHGGHIEVRSQLGRGTTFSVDLPSAGAAPGPT